MPVGREPPPLDAELILRALAALDVDYVLIGGLAGPLNLDHEHAPIDAAMLPRATIWQFDTVGGGLDVLHDVPGGAPYDDLRERVLEVELGSITVPVAGLDDLIRMKLARGCPIDLEDVAALTDPNV